MNAVTSSVSLIDRTWVDTARLAGGRPSRAFWSIGWPMARHDVVRAASDVFLLTLIEPGAPLILGLRNTLPAKLVESALGLGSEPRAATLATIGLVLGFAVRGLLRGPAGPRHNPPAIPGDWTRRRASLFSAITAAATLGLWITFALMPLIGVARLSLAMNQSGRTGFPAMVQFCQNGQVAAALGHSLTLGLGATLIASIFAWSLGPLPSKVSWRNPTSWSQIVPPLAIGLGIYLLPAQLDMVLSRFGSLGTAMAHGLGDFADPYRSPWLVLIVSTSLFAIPTLRREFSRALAIDVSDAQDVARTLGASRWNARLTCSPQFLRIIAAAVASSIATSAIATAPALILARTVTVQPVAVTIATIIADPAERSCAAILGLLALAFPTMAWFIGKSGELKFPRFRLARS
jgi:iron(III) transport system permease protein